MTDEIEIHVVDAGEDARMAVLAMIRRYVGEDAVLEHDEYGAPVLSGGGNRYISVSHSANFAAIALHPDRRIGVDVEEDRPEQLRRVKHKFLSDRDAAMWDSRLLEAWTCKEAVYKAAGQPGLPLREIALGSGDVAVIPDGRRFAMNTRRVSPDCVLTVAIEIFQNI